MKITTLAVTLLTGALAHAGLTAPLSAAPLSEQDKQFLATYEKVHTALAADDLPGAQSAARELGDEGGAIADAHSLADARAGFEKLSVRAKTLVAGQAGYHVFHCPMLKKDWVQTSTTAANPYAGKAMIRCGEIQK